MAIRWQIQFQSLRSKTVYTVNIYDNDCNVSPVLLKGAAQPFTTEEDGDEDFFAFVRTQSGYIRIVDDGKDAAGRAFNYRDLLPTTDTDRPVTLTDESGRIHWQGYMQAQNFGSRMYGGTQVREFPVQCPLTVLSRLDVRITPGSIKNFAYLLKHIVEGIPTLTIDSVIVQGGAAAQDWLKVCIDRQVFAETDNKGALKPKYNLLECLEYMCSFWGWSARTHGQTIYMMRPDDGENSQLLTMTRQQLDNMAEGNTDGTVGGEMANVQVGDEFTDTENQDIQMRGPSRAVVTSDIDESEGAVLWAFPEDGMRQLLDMKYPVFQYAPGVERRYTSNATKLSSGLLRALVVSGETDATFNLMSFSDPVETLPVIRIKTAYNGLTKASLQSEFEHSFNEGNFTLKATIYDRLGQEFREQEGTYAYGKKSMVMRLGIGHRISDSMWWDGKEWVSAAGGEQPMFRAKIGGEDSTLWTGRMSENRYARSIPVPIDLVLTGYIYIHLFGSEDFDNANAGGTDVNFDIANFTLEFSRVKYALYEMGLGRRSAHEYTAETHDNTFEEWSCENIFASEDYSKFGHGVLLNPDGSYYTFEDAELDIHDKATEQKLAQRVVNYWATSKRRIEASLRADIVEAQGPVTPAHTMTIDGTKMYPVSISHDWCDDVLKVSAMELNK